MFLEIGKASWRSTETCWKEIPRFLPSRRPLHNACCWSNKMALHEALLENARGHV